LFRITAPPGLRLKQAPSPPVVAEKLGRKWIPSDLGKFGIHTTRKR
jgi:hypothetical protein